MTIESLKKILSIGCKATIALNGKEEKGTVLSLEDDTVLFKTDNSGLLGILDIIRFP